MTNKYRVCIIALARCPPFMPRTRGRDAEYTRPPHIIIPLSRIIAFTLLPAMPHLIAPCNFVLY